MIRGGALWSTSIVENNGTWLVVSDGTVLGLAIGSVCNRPILASCDSLAEANRVQVSLRNIIDGFSLDCPDCSVASEPYGRGGRRCPKCHNTWGAD